MDRITEIEESMVWLLDERGNDPDLELKLQIEQDELDALYLALERQSIRSTSRQQNAYQ